MVVDDTVDEVLTEEVAVGTAVIYESEVSHESEVSNALMSVYHDDNDASHELRPVYHESESMSVSHDCDISIVIELLYVAVRSLM